VSPAHEARVRRFLAAASRSELDAALLVADVLAHPADRTQVDAALERLAVAAGGALDASALAAFMDQSGFRGAAERYYALDNSLIERVLANRRGIPITFAIVYIEVARRLGLDAHGIGFPGHFLVRVAGDLVDPFGHRVLTPSAYVAFSQERQPNADPQSLATRASADAIALRMINNVKGLVAGQGSRGMADALDLIDCQLVLGGDPTALNLERAELWRRLGSIGGARAALEDARASCADAALAREIDERLSKLPGTNDDAN
jgi:regulator of sirC expression with transglutaminase-like and TPR domain